MVLHVLADARRIRARPARRGRCSSAPGPMPETSSSCGEATAPAARITSRIGACDRASRRSGRTRRRRRFLPSNRMRVVCASVSTVQVRPPHRPGGDSRPRSSSAGRPCRSAGTRCTPSWSRGVDVGRARDAGLDAGLEQGLGDRVRSGKSRDVQRAADAVELASRRAPGSATGGNRAARPHRTSPAQPICAQPS